ncbi:hypothetical protein RN001_010936 [Aquatica leii]|uniref:PPM-type phosphatase domain-containing protein n=1 Tax=Aquatica leii TaxID=1421715 RepID=A0AAN7SQK2_9COLE|nr:hypothetical protein RN001_010936 [Aquatica leii]
MPSLRKKVSSYFRQLSFYNEPRDRKYNVNENSFVTRYLEGQIVLKEGPAILYGKNPTDLPNHDLGLYEIGHDTIVGCYSGPNGGLTTVTRSEKHLSVPDTDIDFIDTQEEAEVPVISTPPLINKVDNMTMLIKVAGQEYLVTNRKKPDNKSHSLGSLSDFEIEIEKTKICTDNNNSNDVKCKNQELANLQSDNHVGVAKNDLVNKRNSQSDRKKSLERPDSSKVNYGLSKSKSEGNPFPQKKKGKIIRIASRQTNAKSTQSDKIVPEFWNRKCDYIYGISNSLYDKNQVTKQCNGDPIADCFGIIARNDSAILAVADGVNWGEKASIAAKSAVHGSLHYLNKTIFNDTVPFVDLDTTQKSDPILNPNRVGNTREVFICLLRAFNCAHDLILENEGMLTTLTVAVVLPLKGKARASRSKERDSLSRRPIGTKPEDLDTYVCCVCNVGDTLAYVYSHKYGVRELTKGSHDINCNRDMRDALGALGPVDGINPELSNLTLSLTTIHKGDIIMIASDGLTDNFDPNVCKFTVNTNDVLKPKRSSTKDSQPSSSKEIPIKPPRKNKPRAPSVGPDDYDNPLIAQFMRANSHDSNKSSTSGGKPRSVTTVRKPEPNAPVKTKSNTGGFLRSKTSLDMRTSMKTILRNEDGIPFVTPLQRYEISLLLMEDILKRGISGHDLQCTTAKKVCENLVNFTFSISSAKRHTLEDSDLYFDNLNGVMVEVSQQEKKIRRRRGLERVQNLPGKLDHVSIVAYNVGNFAHAY